MAKKHLVLESGYCLTLHLVQTICEFLREITSNGLKNNSGILSSCMMLKPYIRFFTFDTIYMDDEGFIIAINKGGVLEGNSNLKICQNTIILESGMINKLGLNCGDHILI